MDMGKHYDSIDIFFIISITFYFIILFLFISIFTYNYLDLVKEERKTKKNGLPKNINNKNVVTAKPKIETKMPKINKPLEMPQIKITLPSFKFNFNLKRKKCNLIRRYNYENNISYVRNNTEI